MENKAVLTRHEMTVFLGIGEKALCELEERCLPKTEKPRELFTGKEFECLTEKLLKKEKKQKKRRFLFEEGSPSFKRLNGERFAYRW